MDKLKLCYYYVPSNLNETMIVYKIILETLLIIFYKLLKTKVCQILGQIYIENGINIGIQLYILFTNFSDVSLIRFTKASL